ncbi:hypothetical protein BDF20DRAFT_1001944, partial [Mycotypha africana]|uniref:uncharacterized protein n=1 Tax=Mycotypha africana TaxID=64632 RepID=UPI0022FFCCA8
MTLNTTQKMLVCNNVRSDGFPVDFVFSKNEKAKDKKAIEDHRLTLEDFKYAEIEA